MQSTVKISYHSITTAYALLKYKYYVLQFVKSYLIQILH